MDHLVGEHGSVAAVAARVAALRGHAEDVESVERALRRLRGRGVLPGGVWGERLLRAFGLPPDIEQRLRFMGSYHSRFVDLPVSLCVDIVQLWDRPPTSETRVGRLWLALARANLAIRGGHPDAARPHLDAARRVAIDGPGAVEVALATGWLESADAPAAVAPALAPVEGWLAAIDGDDGDCLRARYAGQVAHALNRAGRYADGEALHVALPDAHHTHPFARSRRANGLAYARWRLGDPEAAVRYARVAATHAGDAGHVRLRAMALLMVARVARGTPEADDARARARVIARTLEDAVLLARVERSETSDRNSL